MVLFVLFHLLHEKLRKTEKIQGKNLKMSVVVMAMYKIYMSEIISLEVFKTKFADFFCS